MLCASVSKNGLNKHDSYFFKERENEMILKSDLQKIETRDAMRGGAGSIHIKHFVTSEQFKAKSRLCAELILPPGAGIGKHDHQGEDEVYIILSGSGIVTDNGEEKVVAAGDAILTGNGASHAIRNNGKKDLKMIAVIMQY